MSHEYQIWLKEPDGTTIQPITDWHRLNYQWFTNGVGTLILDLPLDYWSVLDVDGDGRPDRDMWFNVHRAVDGGDFNLLFDTCCFARHYTRNRAAGTLTVRAKTATTLLNRRIVAARPGTNEASMSDSAAVILTDVVTDAFQSGMYAFAGRIWTSKVGIATPVTGTPTLARDFAYANVLKVCRRLVQASWELGNYLAFDIVVDATATGGLLFKTYSGQRGSNRTDSIVLSANFGNIEPTTDTLDYENEISVSYIGGPGEGRYRQIETATIDALSSPLTSPRWAWIEDFHSATQQHGVFALANEAFAQLREQRVSQIFGVQALQVPGYQFGVDYFHGDLITLYDDLSGVRYTARIDRVGIVVDADGETIDISLEVES